MHWRPQRGLTIPDPIVPPQAKGVLPGDIPIRGARARRFDSVRVQTKVCMVCGLHPGRPGQWAESRANTGVGGAVRNAEWCEPRCVPGSQVRTPSTKNGQERKLNAGAGLRPISRWNRENRPMSKPETVIVGKPALARVCWLLVVESWQNGEGTQGHPKTGRPWQRVRSPDTPARRSHCVPASRSARGVF
jgi:hypothetical protein